MITKLQIQNPIWLEFILARKDAVEDLAELSRTLIILALILAQETGSEEHEQ